MSNGKIIVGYQGIGKSTLGGKDGFIDLESGNFWIDGKHSDDWYIIYCNIAYHLAQQGYSVFVSSHEVVRKQLQNYDIQKIIIYPSLNLKDQWIERLKLRYDHSGLDKDYKTMMNAVDRYDENIKELMNSTGFIHIQIEAMNYILNGLIDLYK